MTDNIKLPPMPDETFDAHGPIWGHILDWSAAKPGHAAGKHADAIDAAITRVLHDYAREAVRLNAQAAPAAPQPTDEKDALLRQALEALEPFELSTSLAERTAEAIRSHLGVKP